MQGLVATILGHEDEPLGLEASFSFHTVFKISEILFRHLYPALYEVLLNTWLVPEELALADEVILRASTKLKRQLLLLLNHLLVVWIADGPPIKTLLKLHIILVFAFLLGLHDV